MSRTEMLEAKDPAIKLFGKTISFPDIPATAAAAALAVGDPLPLSSDTPVDDSYSLTESEKDDTNRVEEGQESEKDHPLGGSLTDAKQEGGAKCLTLEETTYPNVNSPINENPKTPSVEKESATEKTSSGEEEQSENGNSEEKTLKKPDKIIPCPRCSSMDTKFCYYNNYNLNQPRYFCKNCQRYWTAGGTMRNVPVGAGRRKNKNLASHYRQIPPEALVLVDLPNGIHHPPLKPSGSVLAFGSDTPRCEPITSVLNIAEKTMNNCKINGFQRPEELRIPVFAGDGEIGDDKSTRSSGIAVNSNFHSFPPQGMCFPGSPWPYPWNSSQWSPPVPPFYYVAPYWSCSVPGSWNVPWVSPPTFSPNQTTPSSGPMSPTLGKHSRDEDLPKQTNSGEEASQKENNPKKCFWIPKTLRIDDPGEAAKSSIWSALGIKHDKANSISGGGIFKAFQSKGEEKNYVSETSAVLQANPAALCRSLNFQERV